MAKPVIRVRDLKDQLGTNYPRPFLFCDTCGAKYSAHAGDYWNRPDDDVMRCCRRPLRLVTERCVLEDV